MRIRSTKPEFWRSRRVASVSWDARLVLKGIESYVDDNGVGKDDLALIVSDVFPRDLSRNPPGTLQKVAEALSELSEAGLLWRYEANGDDLLCVAFWENIQRIEKPSKGRLPRPDGTMDYRDSVIPVALPESSLTTTGALRPGTGEQGNRGTAFPASASADDESANATPPPASSAAKKPAPGDFDTWWTAYPRKKDKGHARKAYAAALKKTDASTLLEAIRSQARSLVAKGEEYAPYPATWLNGERWEDEAPAGDDGPPRLPTVAEVRRMEAEREARERGESA